jgi:general secretion pathway protein D
MTNKKNLLLILAASLLLAGCAGEQAHREGLEMMDAGRVEDGLAKLEEATREAPNNVKFRADLISKREQYVSRMLLLADKERAMGRPEEAQVLYERVLVLDRQNIRAQAGLDALERDRRHGTTLAEAQEMYKKGDLEGASAKLRTILLESPDDSDAKALQQKIEDRSSRQAMDTPALQSKFKKPVTLQFRDANLKMVFEALSRTSGINILLDKDVRSDLKTTIFVKDVSVEDTIDLILMQNQLEKKILSENTVFIYPNTPSKIREYQDLKIRSFHFVNADAKNMMTMIKTVLKTRDLFLDEKTNSIVMRDTPDAIRLAEKLIANQDTTEPEVIMEVEVLEVSRSRLAELGFQWPNQVSFTVNGDSLQSTPITTTPGGATVQGATNFINAPLTLESLRHGPAAASVTVSPLTWTLNLRGEDNDANLLASPRIRARNKEKAKIMVGDRVPVITNTVTPVSTGTPVVTGNVQYLDVGLKLEVEPNIHPDGDVAIKINLEVSSLVKEVTTASGTLAYQIGTRNASTLLRLKDGETQVLAGLINDQDREAAQKVPGLGDLPILGRLFSSARNTKDKTEIILSITPHIVRNAPQPDAQTAEFWSGTDASLRSKPLTLQPVGQITMPRQGIPVAAAIAQPPVVSTAPALQAAPLALSWQGPTQAKVGQPFQLTLNAQTAGEALSFPLRISYDPTVLKPVEVKEGDFLKRNDVKSLFTTDLDPVIGQISINMAGTGGEGVTGGGSLVVVTFEPTSAKKPQAEVSLIGIAPTTPEGKPMPVSPPGLYTVNLSP